MKKIKLYKANSLTNTLINLTGSKSESNRALIINALCESPGKVENLSSARDTDIMQHLLASDEDVLNAQDAGTVMRFMTAYLALKDGEVELTGTEHMKKRPVGILVDALKTIGFDIQYLENEGYPPLKIGNLPEQKINYIVLNSTVSSQYISALLMIAPRLPEGLTIKLKGKPVSTPYIDMTVNIMEHFGVHVDVKDFTYSIKPQSYAFKPFEVEADWSGASYWYSLFAISDLDELRLSGLRMNSIQGDAAVVTLMESFGVYTRFEGNVAVLSKINALYPTEIDFIKYPDLAQTFAVLSAVLGHECVFKGLQTLKIKETDRVVALKTELNKLGADLIEKGDTWTLLPAPYNQALPDSIEITTYDDHRMAMAFAPLVLKMDVVFDNTEVVNKSYPGFWGDLRKVGVKIKD
ncbi:MAG: 3-phosphoshikimate 1-carboxyvinyltransferase [Bacteroidota bacterium]